MNSRCSARVYHKDYLHTGIRRCKKSLSFIFQDIEKNKEVKLCHIHANKLYWNNITYIQKIFRGSICRRKLSNIFYKLPTDLQRKILWNISLPVYEKRVNILTTKIIINKIKNYTSSIREETLISLWVMYDEPFILDNIVNQGEVEKILNIISILDKNIEELFKDHDAMVKYNIPREIARFYDVLMAISRIYHYHIPNSECTLFKKIKSFLKKKINRDTLLILRNEFKNMVYT